MATFFGSEALISYTAYNSSVTGDVILYTVPAGRYTEIFIQKMENFSGTGGINFTYTIGTYPSVTRVSGVALPEYDVIREMLPGQTFSIDVFGITGTAAALITWRVKEYAAP
jgi:hypothetical protein